MEKHDARCVMPLFPFRLRSADQAAKTRYGTPVWFESGVAGVRENWVRRAERDQRIVLRARELRAKSKIVDPRQRAKTKVKLLIRQPHDLDFVQNIVPLRLHVKAGDRAGSTRYGAVATSVLGALGTVEAVEEREKKVP